MEIQTRYKVNGVFAMAITRKESSCGTNWAAIDSSTYNWMSVSGSYNGQSYGGWRKYNSFNEAVLDFADNIANSSFYFKNNKYTVREISDPYCNPPEEWANGVVNFMKEIYKAAGVDITPQSSSDSSGGGDIISVAKKMKKEMKEDGGFHYSRVDCASTFSAAKNGNKHVCCATFVSWVLQDAGAISSHSNSSSGLAGILEGKSDWKKVYETTTGDISKLQKGDVIWYNAAGHSEIYAGGKKSYNIGDDDHLKTASPTGSSFYDPKYKAFKVYRYLNGGTGTVSNSSGKGYTKTVKVGSKTYKVYNQNSFGGRIPGYGCSISSEAIILSGYGSSKTPQDVSNYVNGAFPRSLSQIASDLTSQKVKGKAVVNTDATQAKKDISNNLKKGMPVVLLVRTYRGFAAHYITLVGLASNGNPIIADPAGGVTYTNYSLNSIVNYIYHSSSNEKGYVLIKK